MLQEARPYVVASVYSSRLPPEISKCNCVDFEIGTISTLLEGQRITRFARYSASGVILMPAAFATFRLMTNSILLFVSTGISPGLMPFKILSTRRAAMRPDSYVFGL